MHKQMAELCMSSTTFKPQTSRIYSYFTCFSGFILSHPLYFLYLIFFSPYLLKTLSFLSPLFVTTSFLLLLLGLSHSNSGFTLFESRQNFFLSTFHVIRQSLRERFGLESQELVSNLEECEAYKLVFAFDTPTSDMVEHLTGEEYLLQSFDDKEVVVDFSGNVGDKPVGEVHQTKSNETQFVEEKRLQDFFDVLDDFDDNVVEKNVDPLSTKSIEVVEEHVDESKMRETDDPIITKSLKVVEENVDESKVRKGSEAKDVNIIGNNNGGHSRKVMSLAKPFHEDARIDNAEYTSNLGSYGSMRREKEWKRTLACKLFEERHNAVVEGDERIDALWERHESDELSKSMRMATDTNNKKNMKKSAILNFYGDVQEEEEEEEEEDDDNDNEEFEITKVQLCCLQAFKFSAGKMNLGMRKPNLVKFSKALKGFGWLHYAKRHGKKEKF